MNITRRQTLKRLAGIAAASGSLNIAGSAIAESPNKSQFGNESVVNDMPDLASTKVHTRLSSASNDVEIVITNTGDQRTRITQLTPSHTSTKRGVFNFSNLMNNGDLVLDAKQSVTVPMTPHAMALADTTSAGQHAQTLTHALRSSFSVVTENSAFAKVDVMDGIRFT